MFWGISLESGKRYSQTVEKSFHISMAALKANTSDKNGSTTIMVEVEKACYPLCTLNPDRIPQQALDYVFTEGEEVLFYTEGGDLEVHLTGYLIDDPNPVEYSSDEEESSEAENNEENESGKNKSKEESSEEDNLQSLISELGGLHDDNEGSVDMWLPRSARKKHKKGDTLEETVHSQISLTERLLDDESEESEDTEWQPGTSKRKLSKKKDSKVQDLPKEKQINNRSNGTNDCSKKVLSPDSSKSKKNISRDKLPNSSIHQNHSSGDILSDKNCSQDEKSPAKDSKKKLDIQNTEDEPHNRRQLPGGTLIEDLVKGTGKKAKKGRQVSLYYKGLLKKSRKTFDECLSGEAFTFRLGNGDVIEGWDVGIEGMYVGGKRILTIPPSQGYGSKQLESLGIPPHSTLVFSVELTKVQ